MEEEKLSHVTHEALKASERRFVETSELLPQPIWEADNKGYFTYTNRAGFKTMGFTKDDLKKGIHFTDIIAKKDRERIKRNFLKRLRGEEISNSEYTCLRKDGSTFPALIYTSRILQNNKLLGVRGITLDISSQKESELKLQKNLRQQELLSEIALTLNSLAGFDEKINPILQKVGEHTQVSRVYIFEDSPDGNSTSNTFEWCNKDIAAQIDELQGIPYEMIPSWRKILLQKGRVYSEDITELPEDVRAILEPQNIKSIIVYPLFVRERFFGFIGFDECVRHKKWDKSELELLKTITGMIANDYEKELSEKSLKESEAKNNAILESIPDILFHLTKEGEILSYRNNYSETLAYKPETFINNNIFSLFPNDFSLKLQNAIRECMKKGFYKMDYSMYLNNKTQHFEARLAKMNEHEIISIVRNVSDRIEYESMLKKERDKARKANKIKTDFLSTMSHEIRTPLNAVVGLTNILLMEHPKKSQIETLSTLKFSSQNLLNIINNILDYNKLSSNKVNLEQIDFNVFELLKGMHYAMNNLARNKNIGLTYHIEEGIPQILVGDSTRLLQVINNLVSNSIKFTREGEVKVRVEMINKTPKYVELKFRVIDTGIGIPKDKIKSIFKDFKQASSSTTREFGGTGLGLAIVKKLLKMMRSDIHVISNPGKGSEFFFNLKLKVGDKKIFRASHKKNINPNTLRGVRVLLVEDNKINQIVARRFLDDWNCITDFAENGQVAVEKVKANDYNIVLMDLQMPVMDGYKATTEIRKYKNGKFKNLPIIALSASALGEIETKAEKFGMDDFVVKPFDPEYLFSIMVKHTGKK